MSLEKLLIFGLALAVFTAFAVWSNSTATDRQTQQAGYKTEIGNLVDKAK